MNVIRLVLVGIPHVENQYKTVSVTLTKQILREPRLITSSDGLTTAGPRQKLRERRLTLKFRVRPSVGEILGGLQPSLIQSVLSRTQVLDGDAWRILICFMPLNYYLVCYVVFHPFFDRNCTGRPTNRPHNRISSRKINAVCL